jgi:hypothetical protein
VVFVHFVHFFFKSQSKVILKKTHWRGGISKTCIILRKSTARPCKPTFTSKKMLHNNYDVRVQLEKISMVVSLSGLLAVNRRSQSSSDSECCSELSRLVSLWACEDCWGSVVVSCYCQNLVTEAGDSSGTLRKTNVRRWKPLTSNTTEDMTVDTSGWSVKCSHALCITESNKSGHQSKTRP